MRKHIGMRPHDIAILLKIVALCNEIWQMTELAHSLKISASEVFESLNRSQFAGLINYSAKKLNRLNLLEFLEHGVKYVFPQHPGSLLRGIPTAHSHPLMKKHFKSEMNYVWPSTKGEVLGLTIEPFYPKQIEAVNEDAEFYKLLALVDVLRVGKVREIKFAKEELRKVILDE